MVTAAARQAIGDAIFLLVDSGESHLTMTSRFWREFAMEKFKAVMLGILVVCAILATGCLAGYLVWR